MPEIDSLALAVYSIDAKAACACEEQGWEIITFADGVAVRLFVVLLPTCEVERLGTSDIFVVTPHGEDMPVFLFVQSVHLEQTQLLLLP